MKAELVADVTLYPTMYGGPTGPLTAEWIGCIANVAKRNSQSWDCRLILDGRPMWPGETRRLGICFLSREKAAQIFREAGKFYLWAAGFFGEAIVVSG